MNDQRAVVTTSESAVEVCGRCGNQEWHRVRGPDCMYAVCSRCSRHGYSEGYDIGWGPKPRYFPDEAGMTSNEWWGRG